VLVVMICIVNYRNSKLIIRNMCCSSIIFAQIHRYIDRAYNVFIMTCTLYDLGHRYRINSTDDVYYNEESNCAVTANSQQVHGESLEVRSLV